MMDYNKIQPTRVGIIRPNYSWAKIVAPGRAPLLMDYEESSIGAALIENEQK